MSYTLTNEKCIEFYKKNPHIDFNHTNELFINLIDTFTNNDNKHLPVSDVKSILYNIHNTMSLLSSNISHNNEIIKLTYDTLNNNKDNYIQQIKNILNENKDDIKVLSLIKETNELWFEKSALELSKQYPKISENIISDFKVTLREEHKDNSEIFKELINSDQLSEEKIEKIIKDNFNNISNQFVFSLQQYFNDDSMFHKNNLQIKNFLENQNNSSIKGKISEEKLEICLNNIFPYGEIINKSGEQKACDYLLKRENKPNILFENKDYKGNVPNEEIKKFIRDIEYQDTHGILLSQNSGIINKQDYQIDIHNNKILLYVHNVNFDKTKINLAVNIIDHLSRFLEEYNCNNSNVSFTSDELLEVNKEYLFFINQKKTIIESYKKNTKDHLKLLEDIELPYLTNILNKLFSNVEQLTYTCDICNNYNAKSKRALTTHKNKCKKENINLN